MSDGKSFKDRRRLKRQNSSEQNPTLNVTPTGLAWVEHKTSPEGRRSKDLGQKYNDILEEQSHVANTVGLLSLGTIGASVGPEGRIKHGRVVFRGIGDAQLQHNQKKYITSSYSRAL